METSLNSFIELTWNTSKGLGLAIHFYKTPRIVFQIIAALVQVFFTIPSGESCIKIRGPGSKWKKTRVEEQSITSNCSTNVNPKKRVQTR